MDYKSPLSARRLIAPEDAAAATNLFKIPSYARCSTATRWDGRVSSSSFRAIVGGQSKFVIKFRYRTSSYSEEEEEASEREVFT